MRTRWISRCLPKSLVGRVFALYTLSLAVFVGAALVLFLHSKFTRELEAAQERAEGLVGVVAPAISDSVVIGDYDTIKRTLEHAIARSDFAFAAFIDLHGGKVKAERADPPDVMPPAWLAEQVSTRLYETNLPIVVGGRDYGVLRLGYAADQIAGEVWGQARTALALAFAGLGLGLLLIWLPLKNWLGNLGRLQSFEAGMEAGAPNSVASLAEDAPIEFQRTFAVLSRAAATLHSEREQAAVTLGAIADAVFTLDADGRVVLANPAACELLASTPPALLGRTMHEVLPELFAEGQTPAPWRGRRQTLTARDGSARTVDTTLSSITDPQGVLFGHVLACRDVSQQHALDVRLQDELRSRRTAMTALRGVLEGLMPLAARRRERTDDIEAISQMISHLVKRMQEHSDQLGAIFALSPDGFVSFDERCTVSYVSPAFARLTGLDESDVLGLTEDEFARLFSARCLAAQADFPSFDLLRAEEGERGERQERRRFLEVERPMRCTLELSLHRSDRGSIRQVLHLRDVTLETEVDRMKSEFLSTAAHELRTPMASIYGFSELMMLRKMTPERQQEAVATIHRQATLVISIVNELLDLARIEARRGKDFLVEPAELGQLAAEVVHDFRPPNDREPPVLHPPGQPLPVRVDRGKFGQALGNVLSNAYKYSPDGGRVELSFDLEDPARVGLRIRDQGMGMTPEQLARVCERFYRAEASGSIPGTGLGMSIVKEIVELLGGSLTLASEPGAGTEVTLWLPRDAAAAARPMQALHGSALDKAVN